MLSFSVIKEILESHPDSCIKRAENLGNSQILMKMEPQRFTVFAGILVLFAVTLSPVEAGARKSIESCMQQTGTTKDDLENFKKTGTASQNLKCTMSCTLKDVKFMTSDGTLDTATAKSKMPASVGGLIDTCASKAQPESDVCQRAFVYLQCFMKAEPKVYIDFITTD